MNILITKIFDKTVILSCAIILYCFSLPFYQIRISLPISSISITSLIALFLIGTLFLFHIRNKTLSAQEDLLWVYGFLFILSFIPSLYIHPSQHALGVFFEWIAVPVFLNFLLYKLFCTHRPFFYVTQNTLHATLLLCLVIAIFYIFSGNLSYDGRLSTMFQSPNHLAMFITPLLMLTLAQKRDSASQNFFKLFIIAIGVIVILFTQSLTTLLACAFTIALYSIISHQRNNFSRYYIAVATITLVLILGFGLFLKISHSDILSQHSSLTSRITIWQSTLHLLQKNTFFGYEIDSFQDHYLSSQKYYTPYQEWAVPTPHNLYFTVLFSGGFFALMTFLLICTRFFYLFYTQPHNAAPKIYPFIILFVLISGLTDTPIWNIALAHVFWLIVAFGIISISKNKKPSI